MKKKLTLIITVCVVCAVFAVGCARNAATPSPTRTPGASPLTSTSPIASPLVTPTPGTSPAVGTGAEANNAELADRIRAEVDKMSEVHNSAVVVDSNTALVGIRFDSAYKGALTDRIAEMVKEKVKEADSNITDIHVTDDVTMIEEIEDMRARMTGETLAEDLKVRFEDLVNRIRPQA